MQSTSEQFKNAVMDPALDFQSRISFPNLVLDDTEVKSITLDSLLVSGNDFKIGVAPMDMVRVELVHNPDDPIEYDFEEKECEIDLGLNIPFAYDYMESFTYDELEQYTYDELEQGIPEYVSMGLFTVEKATKKNNTISLDCVDRMYKAEKDYVSDLVYPTTILDILESACDQAGIELATTAFANSGYIVPNKPVYEGITCRRIFAQVAELAGGYAKINRLGQLEIVALGAESVRDITKDNYIELKINEVASAKIEKVIVKVGEQTATKGAGEHIYTVVDNMFCQNPADVIDELYGVLKDIFYTACDYKWQGDFSLDLGDKVTIDGNDTYILSRKLTYTGGLREDYSAPAKSNVEKNSTGKGNLILDMNRVKTQIKVIDGEITETVERIEEIEGDLGDVEDRVSIAEQKITPEAIVSTVRLSTEYQGDLGDKADNSTVSGISGRLDEAEQKITPNAIVSTVRQSIEYTNDLGEKVSKDTIISEINQTAEEIKIQAERINLVGAVTVNDLSSDFGESLDLSSNVSMNVRIGEYGANENLLKDSNNFDPSRMTPIGGALGTVYNAQTSVPEWGATDATKLAYSSGQLTTKASYTMISRISSLVLDGEYTISCYVKNDSNVNTMRVKMAGLSPEQTEDLAPGKAKKLSFTGIFSIPTSIRLEFLTTDVGHNIAFTIWRVKVERGDTATSWTPALGELKGTTYEFGIDSFKIGGTGGDRHEISPTYIRSYKDNTKRVELDFDSLDFYTKDGVFVGNLSGIVDGYPMLGIQSEDYALWLRSGIDNQGAEIYMYKDHPLFWSPVINMTTVDISNQENSSIFMSAGFIEYDVFGSSATHAFRGDVSIGSYDVMHRGLIQAGQNVVTPVPNTATQATFYFPQAFKNAPKVVATGYTDAAGTSVQEVTVRAVTKTQFTLVVYRTNAANLTVHWIAMEP